VSRLEATNLVVGYDGPPIVNGASVSVESGRVVILLGPNGAGKSTLAKAIFGLLQLQDGAVTIDGENVTGLSAHELVRMGIGYLPQLMNVFDELTILENLEMGAYTFRGDVRRRIQTVLELFSDLRDVPKKRAGQLSGGQQRMLALARVFMIDPRFVILDEPTAGLAPSYAQRVWEQIVRVRDQGVGLLVVEQNVRSAIKHADDAVVLFNGKVKLAGAAQEVAKHEEFGSMMVG
jgi:branched-chain amino acid transport system ATP-binding protein